MPASIMRTLVAALALSVGALATPPGAAAQSMLGRAEATTTNADAAFYYVRAGTASVRVQVLGAVRAPGLYEVSEGTALGPVLALAGGPTLGTTPAGTRSEATVRLFRPGTDGEEVAFEAPLERLVGDAATPALRDGDVLLVEVSGGQVESALTNASSFYYVRAGTASVRVQVLGAVRAPGLYEVSEGTALGPVLALAGGPTLGTTSSDTRTDVTLRLHRPGPGGSELVFEGPFEASVAQGGLPALRDGDVLVTEVRSRRTFGWRDAVQIVGALGVLALAIDRLADLGN